MARGIAKQNLPVVVFFGLLAVSLGGLLLLPQVPQDQSYHQFADQRTIFGIPNFWNVVSNLPFLAVGAAGLRRFRDDPATVVFFLGVFLTGIGSSYYHWDPNDGTLFWDRLPMTLSFAALLALVVEERVNARAGAILLWPALAIGLFSLLLWRWTDDLRLYFWVQFFPGLAVLLLFLLYQPKYTGTHYWIVAGVFYALAKLFLSLASATAPLGLPRTMANVIIRHFRTKSSLGQRIFVNCAILHNDQKVFVRVFDELDVFQRIAIDQ